MEILIIITVTSLACFGWEYITFCEQTFSGDEQGMGVPGRQTMERRFTGYQKPKKPQVPEILWFVRYYIGNFICRLFPKNKELILKPLFHCQVCMSGWMSLVVILLVNTHLIYQWPIIAIAAAGLTYRLKQ